MISNTDFLRLLAASQSDAHLLSFEHQSEYNGGSRWPYDHTLTAVHPEHGEVGSLKYKMSGDRANSKIKIDRLEVASDHRRKGYGSALMDSLQQRYPKSSIDHGDRTDLGKAWWGGYGDGKADKRGRTATVADWQFSHHHIEGPHWRSFGNPASDPEKSVVTEYKLRDGGVQFDTGTLHQHQIHKHGPEAVERLHDAVRQHHGMGDAPPEVPPPPARPKPRIYYHGTTTGDVTHILPASKHHSGVVFPSDTDHDYAYASLDKDAAWSYAEKAHYVTGGKPRVYQVRPMHGDHSHVEEDPQWDDTRNQFRGNYEGDRRSKVGFEVVRELKTPRHIHESFDWPEKEEG
jgi:GNAT superfamily N-acetyltransferase